MLAGLAAGWAAGQEAGVRTAIRQKMERALHGNILGYWYPHSIDGGNGGYRVGRTKGIVAQARMLWFFARMARSGHRKGEMLAAAEQGYRFLRDRLWDGRYGGFYWEVDAIGRRLHPGKHLYGQAFGLYALSEYYLASGKGEAKELASRLFALLDQRGHDGKYGGYRESFREDWAADTGAGIMSPPALKLMNTHLHLMEALAWYVRATGAAVARERLLELIGIETNAVVRKGVTACTDKYNADWTPRLEGSYGVVSYGHDLENVWMVMDAAEAAGISAHPYLELFRALWANALRFGYDGEKGGFYDTGPLGKPAERREKVWWVQAEAMVSALRMWRMTGERLYWDVFAKTWAFVDQRQIDWAGGEWHATILPDGSVRGAKADAWKAAYHTGRSMLECMQLLG